MKVTVNSLIMNFNTMNQTEKMDKWFKYLNEKLEDDIDKLLVYYINEFSKETDISELEDIDVFQTYYDVISDKFCNHIEG